MRPEESLQAIREMQFLDFTFPYDKNLPRGGFQQREVVSVPRYSRLEFGLPELLPCSGPSSKAATRMPVPEAATYLDDLSPAGEDDIGPPRQIARVQAVAIAHSVNEPPYSHLWSCVFSANSGHISAPRIAYLGKIGAGWLHANGFHDEVKASVVR